MWPLPSERVRRTATVPLLVDIGISCVFPLVVMLAGCGSASVASNEKSGGGPIGYATSWLVPMTLRPSTFAALIVGLRTIEVIDMSSSSPTIVTATSPAAAGCGQFPVSIAAGDVNADGSDDILVMDPSCGNWVGLGKPSGALDGFAWSDVAPELSARYFLRVVELEDQRPMIVSATESNLAGGFRFGNGLWKSWAHQLGARTSPWLSLMDIFAVRNNLPGGVEVLFQTEGFLTPVQVQMAGVEVRVEQGADIAEEPIGGAIRAHSGFDHLVGFVEESCDIVAMGIGFYPKAAGNLPRRVAVLRRTGDRFIAEELPFDCDTITFGVAVQSPDVFVGALARCGSSVTAQLARLRECGRRTEIVARQDVEFAWQRPPAPPGYSEPTLPATDGIAMYVEALEANAIRLATYDGFTLRTIIMQEGTSRWSAREERFQLHTNREDVAW